MAGYSFLALGGVICTHMKNLLQRLLDRAEDYCTRRYLVALTFHILSIKRALGLRYWQ